MSRKIKDFENGIKLYYDYGCFDDWCVHIIDKENKIYRPKDKVVFNRLLKYASKYGTDSIYEDFTKIYNLTSKNLSNDVIELISKESKKYTEDEIGVSVLFTLLYACMVAEENKKDTKLGKRIKMLGVHQLLKDKMSCEEAANFSKRKNSRLLKYICESKGF